MTRIYFIERISDGLIFNGWLPGPQSGSNISAWIAAAVREVGGSAEDWSLSSAEYEPEADKTVRLIEPDGAGGYTISQDQMLKTAGLAATLTKGWFGGCKVMAANDVHTFSSPGTDTAIALDVVKDDVTGAIELQPYTWDPATESKADPPAGVTVIQADLLRGVLPAGASSLDQLEEE
ncbi:MAG: hypothetical protein JRC92_09670 [Deltaproteobacteria bacterium]|nr:hypothetical protein [Deltaproteobacteria bacterium]